MARAFFDSAWGTIRLWCAEVSTVNGRRIVTHTPTSGDEHETQDRGLEQRVTTCELLFDDMDGETTSPAERFDRFRELVERGESQVFTHPLIGSFRATVGRFDHRLRDGVIYADAEFVPVGRIPAVTVAAAGMTAVAGIGAIGAAATVAEIALSNVGLSSPAIAASREAADAWQEDDSTIRRVLVDVGQLCELIASEIDRLELETDNALWLAQRALLLLSDAVVLAGRAQTSDVARIMTVHIDREIALRPFLASVYGARDVDTYYPIAMSLNDIPTPGWIPSGFNLLLPQPLVQPRRG